MESLWKVMLKTNLKNMTHCLESDHICGIQCVCDHCDDIQLKNVLIYVCNKVKRHKLDVESVKKVLKARNNLEMGSKSSVKSMNLCLIWSESNYYGVIQSLLVLVVLLLALLYQKWDHLITSRCVVANNYFVMEVTRPVSDCGICRHVDRVVVLENVTKEAFAKYAYSGQPIVVRGATHNWLALNTFNFHFFRQIYAEIPDAYQSVEEECQFFPFKTEFHRLSEVFSMPDERVTMNASDVKSWYIGWSNCNPDVANILRQHYNRPNFLPDDSESSAIDWIFMGYSEIGASMHLDYVQRPSWQAQISGSKTWHLLPPPECENECTAINISVHKGDIILIDTNQWYHDTHINPGEISVTIGSEYD